MSRASQQPSHARRSSPLRATVLLAVGATTVATLATAPAASGGTLTRKGPADSVTISRTEHGIPHITSGTYRGAGLGYGYAIAQDNLCQLVDGYLTVDGARSRYYGPAARPGSDFATASTNLTSDLYFAQLKESGIVEELLAKSYPQGPRAEVRELVEGYVDGFNRWVADSGTTSCGPVPVRTITTIDVYRHMYALTLVAGSGQWADSIAMAAPPTAAPGGVQQRSAAPPAGASGSDAATSEPTEPTEEVRRGAAALREQLDRPAMGSNAFAIGSQASATGHSILLGNPHYPWQGMRRFYQAQITVPGRMDVSGGTLLGFPIVQIGFNADVAWSHTVATPRTFGLRKLTLVPGDPTSYLVDGRPEAMTSHQVTIQVRQADGSVAPMTRTLWSSRYGSLLAGHPSLPLSWTGTTAYALEDANAQNLRGLNTWFGFNTAKDLGDLTDALHRTQGIPWVNTVAIDRGGQGLYADIQVVPNVSDAFAMACSDPMGQYIYGATRFPVLDGSRSACAWPTAPNTVQPGTMDTTTLPFLVRDDWVYNSNDSAWLTNPAAPITDYPLIVGDKNTARTLRTRMGYAAIQDRLSGADGLSGKGFTPETMGQMLFLNDSMAARLARTDTVAMCRSLGGSAPTSTGATVPVGDACDVLDAWDGTFRVDSVGAVLFDRFWVRAANVGPWTVPFDPAQPLTTPHTLATDKPAVRAAFGDALAEVAGLDLGMPWGDHHFVTRLGERIAIPGAAEPLGVLDMMVGVWQPGTGYAEMVHGTSYVQVVSFDEGRCPNASALLTYSESTDPASPWFADQTELFSKSTWVPQRFCQNDIQSSPVLAVTHLKGR